VKLVIDKISVPSYLVSGKISEVLVAPLVVLGSSLIILRLLGLALPALADWPTDARYALALMLLLTAWAHFVQPMRQDLIRMVPSRMPRRAHVVTLTGVLEVAAAAGLVVPATAPLAGAGLVLLLIAMFPANVKAAVENLPLRGKRATPLALRLPMQILFIAIALWSSQPAGLVAG
jgi:uncharacterized membrane protein